MAVAVGLLGACAAVTGLGDYVIGEDPVEAGVDAAAAAAPAPTSTTPVEASAPDTGCVVCDVVSAGNVIDVATSPTAIYWIDTGNIIRTAALDGSSPRQFLAGEAVPLAGLELRADYVFWTAGGQLRRTPADRDGAIDSLGDMPNVACVHFGNARILSTVPEAGIIYSTGIDGGTGPLVNGQPNIWGVDSNTPDATFFTTYDPTAGAIGTKILGVPQDAGFTTLYTGQRGPRCMAVDEREIFWANRESGEIVRGTFEGAPTVVLASGQTAANGISFQAPYLYWTWAGGIRRLRVRP